jgi:hypothetical protein
MSRAGVLLGVVAVAAVAGGVWWLQQPSDNAGEGPAPVPVADGEPMPPRPPSVPREIAPPATAAPAPREAVASADDVRIPIPTDWPGGLRIQVPDVPESLEVTGEKLRDALLATPGLYVRWASAAVRDAFLKGKVRVPRELTMTPAGAPPEARGAPLPMILGAIEQAGFSARLEPPVLRISEGGAAPPRDQPSPPR